MAKKDKKSNAERRAWMKAQFDRMYLQSPGALPPPPPNQTYLVGPNAYYTSWTVMTSRPNAMARSTHVPSPAEPEPLAWGDEATATPLVGWRGAGLTVGGFLCSPYYNHTWTPLQRQEAFCMPMRSLHHILHPEDEEEPQPVGAPCANPNHHCGFNTSLDLQEPIRFAEGAMGVLGGGASGGAIATILVETHLWGRVVATEKGYRGQYAYPKRIVIGYREHPRTGLHPQVAAIEEALFANVPPPRPEHVAKTATNLANLYKVPVDFCAIPSYDPKELRIIQRTMPKENHYGNW